MVFLEYQSNRFNHRFYSACNRVESHRYSRSIFAKLGFHFWEIPIIVAFLMFGLKIGVTVAVLRTLAALTLFPTPAGFVAPPITLLATLGIAARALRSRTDS